MVLHSDQEPRTIADLATTKKDTIMSDITKEALTELGMRLHFHASEMSTGFYFARAT